MVRPKVDSRLQNIEQGIENIIEILCKNLNCAPKEDVAAETGEEE